MRATSVPALSLVGAKVGITGATGFVGAALAEHLAGLGAEVRVFVRNPDRLTLNTSNPGATVTPVVGALDDAAALERFTDGLDALIHCAGLTHARTRRDFFAVNVDGAAQIAAAFSRGRIKGGAGNGATAPTGGRFVHISSLAARHPRVSAYAASKRASEDAVSRASHLPVVTLRAPALFGPRDRATLSFFKAVRMGLAPVPSEAGRRRASILFIDDFVAAVITALTMPLDASPALFEVGDAKPDGHSWAEIAAACGAASGKSVRLLPLPRPVLHAHAVLNAGVQRLVGRAPMVTPEKIAEFFHPDWAARDNRLQDKTGWAPELPLTEGFRRTVEWYRREGWL